MELKKKIFDHCMGLLDVKIHELENMLLELSESAAKDTKSSAGDKHETARAMIQIEQENIGKQLSEVLEQKAQLERVAAAPLSFAGEGPGVRSGCLVKTNKGYVFLSIALGKITVDGNTVMVISPHSPLGVKLMGLIVGNSAEINGANYLVERIY